MFELLTLAATQVPSLVVLCVLVHIFVNSLKAERTAIETIASDALDRNTEAMANNQRGRDKGTGIRGRGSFP